MSSNNFKKLEAGDKIIILKHEGVDRFLETNYDESNLGSLESLCKEAELTAPVWIGFDTQNSLDLGVTVNGEPVESQKIDFMVVSDPSDWKVRPVTELDTTDFLSVLPANLI